MNFAYVCCVVNTQVTIYSKPVKCFTILFVSKLLLKIITQCLKKSINLMNLACQQETEIAITFTKKLTESNVKANKIPCTCPIPGASNMQGKLAFV